MLLYWWLWLPNTNDNKIVTVAPEDDIEELIWIIARHNPSKAP